MPSYAGNELLESIHQPINIMQQEILLKELKHRQQREQLELEQLRQRWNKEETKCDEFGGGNGHHHKNSATNWIVDQQRNGTSTIIGGRIAAPNATNLSTAPSILPIYGRQQLSEYLWLTNRCYHPALQNQFLANPNIQPSSNFWELFDQQRR